MAVAHDLGVRPCHGTRAGIGKALSASAIEAAHEKSWYSAGVDEVMLRHLDTAARGEIEGRTFAQRHRGVLE